MNFRNTVGQDFSKSVLELRNRIDFWLRNTLSVGRKLSHRGSLSAQERGLQQEIKAFNDLFDWSPLISHWTSLQRTLWVADVGCRDFGFAPIWDDFFFQHALSASLHGFEVDAFRRMTDLRVRRDYGQYFARQVREGTYHPQDFLNHHQDWDLVYLLNPFVSLHPLMAWGLPQKLYRPQKMWDHCYACLSSNQGHLLLSNPSAEEFEIALRLSQKAGFKVLETQTWFPQAQSVNLKPRFGALLGCASGV